MQQAASLRQTGKHTLPRTKASLARLSIDHEQSRDGSAAVRARIYTCGCADRWIWAAAQAAGSGQWGQIRGRGNKQGADRVSGARGTRPRARCPPAAARRGSAGKPRAVELSTRDRHGRCRAGPPRARAPPGPGRGWAWPRGFGVARHGMGAWLVAWCAGAGGDVPCRAVGSCGVGTGAGGFAERAWGSGSGPCARARRVRQEPACMVRWLVRFLGDGSRLSPVAYDCCSRFTP